jgi:hypothetical protein
MIAGLSKTIPPLCKPTTRELIRKDKHTRIHHFMHIINIKWREKEIIGVIVQGFTCLALQTAQNLAFEGLEYYPMPTRLN